MASAAKKSKTTKSEKVAESVAKPSVTATQISSSFAESERDPYHRQYPLFLIPILGFCTYFFLPKTKTTKTLTLFSLFLFFSTLTFAFLFNSFTLIMPYFTTAGFNSFITLVSTLLILTHLIYFFLLYFNVPLTKIAPLPFFEQLVTKFDLR